MNIQEELDFQMDLINPNSKDFSRTYDLVEHLLQSVNCHTCDKCKYYFPFVDGKVGNCGNMCNQCPSGTTFNFGCNQWERK